MTTAWLQFSNKRPDGMRDTFQTIPVPYKHAPLGWQRQGLTYTATGYGARIPSRHMVQWEGRWRRVYVTQYANAGSAWVLIGGERVPVDIYHGQDRAEA